VCFFDKLINISLAPRRHGSVRVERGYSETHVFLNVDCCFETATWQFWHRTSTFLIEPFFLRDDLPEGQTFFSHFFSPLWSLEQPRAVLVENQELLWFVS
jgi:hypothetical protein